MLKAPHPAPMCWIDSLAHRPHSACVFVALTQDDDARLVLSLFIRESWTKGIKRVVPIVVKSRVYHVRNQKEGSNGGESFHLPSSLGLHRKSIFFKTKKIRCIRSYYVLQIPLTGAWIASVATTRLMTIALVACTLPLAWVARTPNPFFRIDCISKTTHNHHTQASSVFFFYFVLS